MRKFKDNNFVVLEGGGIGLTLAREGRRRIEVGRRFDARHSELTGNTTFHDYASLALGINDKGDVVGASLDTSFNLRALLREKGVISDLNTRTAANPSGLYLLLAESIDSRAEIVGLAVTSTGLHGFLATPVH